VYIHKGETYAFSKSVCGCFLTAFVVFSFSSATEATLGALYIMGSGGGVGEGSDQSSSGLTAGERVGGGAGGGSE